MHGAGETIQQLRALWLLLQRIWVQFPKLTWLPTTICNSILWDPLLWPLWTLYTLHRHKQAKHPYTIIKK